MSKAEQKIGELNITEIMILRICPTERIRDWKYKIDQEDSIRETDKYLIIAPEEENRQNRGDSI